MQGEAGLDKLEIVRREVANSPREPGQVFEFEQLEAG